MITKEILSAFVENHRIKQKRTWDATAEAAFKKLQIGRPDGKPFTGAGFQSYVERHTGRLKWGASVNRQPKPTLFSGGEVAKPEPEVWMGMPVTPAGTLPPMLKDVLASNLNADSKVKILDMLLK